MSLLDILDHPKHQRLILKKSAKRDVPGKVAKRMKAHLNHVNKVLMWTTKVDGLRVDEPVHNDILTLAENGRLSSKYTDALVKKYGFDRVAGNKQYQFKVKNNKDPVNTELMRALALACRKDNTIRDSLGLEACWRQATTMNQRDCF